MSEYTYETIEAGEYRARVVHDEFGYEMKPDGDFFGTVYQMESVSWGARVETLGTSYAVGDPGLGSEISRAWAHFADMALVERYLRMFFEVVGFDYIDRDYGKIVNVVTMADLKCWGFESVEAYRTQTGHDDPSHGNLTEWEAWANGEVFFVVVERKVLSYTQVSDLSGNLVREAFGEDWETVDSIHGFYGTEYAIAEANEMLAGYAEPLAVGESA